MWIQIYRNRLLQKWSSLIALHHKGGKINFLKQPTQLAKFRQQRKKKSSNIFQYLYKGWNLFYRKEHTFLCRHQFSVFFKARVSENMAKFVRCYTFSKNDFPWKKARLLFKWHSAEFYEGRSNICSAPVCKVHKKGQKTKIRYPLASNLGWSSKLTANWPRAQILSCVPGWIR